MSDLSLCIFSSGRHSSICSVSSVMPKNVIMHAGPSILSVASGMPRRSDKASMISSAAAHLKLQVGQL